MGTRDGITCCVFGMKGSGKTKFTVKIIAGMPRVIVFDPKRSYRKELPKWRVVTTLDGLLAALKANPKRFNVIYEPEPEWEVEELNQVSRLVERLQVPYLNETSHDKIMVCVEEAHLPCPNPTKREFNGFARLVKMGRESGIDIISVTQQPQDLAVFVRQNTDRVACFQVSGEQAVDAAAKTMICRNRPDGAIADLKKYEFVFYENGEWQKKAPISL